MASARTESQVEIIKSDEIARSVIKELALIDSPSSDSGIVGSVMKLVRSRFGEEKGLTDEEKLTAGSTALAKRVKVRRLGVSYAIEITAEMPDPVLTARVANAYASNFMKLQMRLREDRARHLTDLLQTSTLQLQAQARKAEKAVEEMKFSGPVAGSSSVEARVALRDLESTAQTYRSLHDRLMEHFVETSQHEILSLPDAQIASAAQVPMKKSSPNTLLVISAALFLGIFVGAIIALYRA
jgi:uncharacterized protein involved in exopolysaccharide biosynthesis